MVQMNRPVLQPDGSIPGDFYDFDYYENGAASGKFSYNGYDYSTQLELCKYWAQDTINRWGPFKSYLELGCGRGWAVWGMMNLGLGIEVKGVDISHYALTTTMGELRSVLVEHDASDLSFIEDKSFDLIFSNDFMEHITTEQINNCLTHCARIAKSKVVHLVSIGDGINLPEGVAPSEHDQSHISMHSQDWWSNTFRSIFKDSEWDVSITSHGTTIEVVSKRKEV